MGDAPRFPFSRNIAAMTTLAKDDLADLKRAKALLENPGVAAKLSSMLGAPVEKGVRMLPASWQNSVVRAGIDMPIISMDCVCRQRTPGGASAALAAAPMIRPPAARLPAMRLERADLVCIVRLPRGFAVGMPCRGTKGPSLPQAAGPAHFSIVKTRSALRSLPASVLMVQRSPIV